MNTLVPCLRCCARRHYNESGILPGKNPILWAHGPLNPNKFYKNLYGGYLLDTPYLIFERGQSPINENIDFITLRWQSYSNNIIGLARTIASSALAINEYLVGGPLRAASLV